MNDRGCIEAAKDFGLEGVHCCGTCHSDDAERYGDLYDQLVGDVTYHLCCAMYDAVRFHLKKLAP